MSNTPAAMSKYMDLLEVDNGPGGREASKLLAALLFEYGDDRLDDLVAAVQSVAASLFKWCDTFTALDNPDVEWFLGFKGVPGEVGPFPSRAAAVEYLTTEVNLKPPFVGISFTYRPIQGAAAQSADTQSAPVTSAAAEAPEQSYTKYCVECGNEIEEGTGDLFPCGNDGHTRCRMDHDRTCRTCWNAS